MRFPGRLLTDPQRRAFGQRRSVHGGVVIIDQSGSMDIDDVQMATLLRSAPDALVIGYSHRPGAMETEPNAWVLADRGAVVQQAPTGNVGNGVDGPVLEWAISRRRGREPVVWVTDGQVTDSHDHPCEELTNYCANLVLRHRIRMVANLEESGRMLRGSRVGDAIESASFGRVGRKMQELRSC